MLSVVSFRSFSLCAMHAPVLLCCVRRMDLVTGWYWMRTILLVWRYYWSGLLRKRISFGWMWRERGLTFIMVSKAASTVTLWLKDSASHLRRGEIMSQCYIITVQCRFDSHCFTTASEFRGVVDESGIAPSTLWEHCSSCCCLWRFMPQFKEMAHWSNNKLVPDKGKTAE